MLDYLCKHCGVLIQDEAAVSCTACGNVLQHVPLVWPIIGTAVVLILTGLLVPLLGVVLGLVALAIFVVPKGSTAFYEMFPRVRTRFAHRGRLAAQVGAVAVLLISIIAGGAAIAHRLELKEYLDSVGPQVSGTELMADLDAVERRLSEDGFADEYPARTAEVRTAVIARRWVLKVAEARQQIEDNHYAQVHTLVGAIPADHPSAAEAASLGLAASQLAANTEYLSKRKAITDLYRTLEQTTRRKCQLEEMTAIVGGLGHLSPAVKGAGVDLPAEVASALGSFEGPANKLEGHAFRAFTIPELLDKPTLWEPEYSGAFYLSGTLRERYSDGLLVQRGSTYFCVYDAVATNGYARYIEGYVDPTGGTQDIEIGRTGRECQIVNYSNRETYQDDQAAHRERVRAAKAEYDEERARYRESKSQRKAAQRKKVDLDRDYAALCGTLRDDLEAFFDSALVPVLVDPPVVAVPPVE